MVVCKKPTTDTHKKHDVAFLMLHGAITDIDMYLLDSCNDIDCRVYILQNYDVVQQWFSNLQKAKLKRKLSSSNK